jgi:protein-S-isoprenylcysteine O-methyltransferase Ste14
MPSLPLMFTWPYDAVYTLVIVGAFVNERKVRRRSHSVARTQDRGSSRVMTVGDAAAVILALGAAFGIPAAAMPARPVGFWIGLSAIIAASILRRHCFSMLGEHFTYIVQVVPGQSLVDRGAYGWVRHPAYLAGTISYIGFGILLGNWISLVILLVGCVVTYAYRVAVEERALTAILGDTYREYCERTKRFIPFVF